MLQESGYFVLWFLAEDVGKHLDDVLDAILRALLYREGGNNWGIDYAGGQEHTICHGHGCVRSSGQGATAMASSLKHSSKRLWHFNRPTKAPPMRRIPDDWDDGDPVVLRLVEFEITDEPIDDPLMRKLPRHDQDRILDAGDRVREGAVDQVDILERLVEEFPDIPKVYNYLAAAYRNAGLDAKIEELVERTYRRFPDYLFGVTNYVHELLRKDRIREATVVLDGRFSLDLWIRNRRKYHVSEFVAFTGLMVRYFAAVGEDEISERYYRMLIEGAPDHPGTQEITHHYATGLLGSLLQWLERSDSDPVLGQSETRQRRHGKKPTRWGLGQGKAALPPERRDGAYPPRTPSNR